MSRVGVVAAAAGVAGIATSDAEMIVVRTASAAVAARMLLVNGAPKTVPPRSVCFAHPRVAES